MGRSLPPQDDGAIGVIPYDPISDASDAVKHRVNKRHDETTGVF